MALLTTWGAHNYVETVPLWGTIDVELVEWWTTGTEYVGTWKFTRTRRKQYRYDGLTREAALRCLAEKANQYRRKMFKWSRDASNKIWSSEKILSNAYYKDVAAVEPVRNGGGAYAVEINVEETVEAYYSGYENLPDKAAWDQWITSVTTANGAEWDYDEDEAGGS